MYARCETLGVQDADDVGTPLVHHAFKIVVCVGDAVAVGGLLGLGQGVIEHADHLYGRGQLQPSGDVTDVGDHGPRRRWLLCMGPMFSCYPG